MPRDLQEFTASLPIGAALPELRAALDKAGAAVLEAPPGAGKTTRVPLALLDAAWLAGQQIVMLEPRRLAARAAARRMAPHARRDGRRDGRLPHAARHARRAADAHRGRHRRRAHAHAAGRSGARRRRPRHLRRIPRAQPRRRPRPRADARDAGAVCARICACSSCRRRSTATRVARCSATRRSSPARDAAFRSRRAISSRAAERPHRGGGRARDPPRARTRTSGSMLVFLPGAGEIRRVERLLAERDLGRDVDHRAALRRPAAGGAGSRRSRPRPPAGARWCSRPRSPRPA